MKKSRLQIALGCFSVASMLTSGAAFGARLGHAGTSVKGATAAQNQVNLISDPVNAIYGTTTSQYDPSVLFVEGVTAATGYYVDSITVQTNDPNDPYKTSSFGDPSTFLSAPDLGGFQEVGAVQVSWELDDDPSTTPQSISDASNEFPDAIGDITHIINFGTLSEAPAFITTLSDIASPGGGVTSPDETNPASPVGTFPNPDTYVEGTTTDPTQESVIGTERTVSAPTTYSGTEIQSSSDTIFVPEPASLTLMGFGATLLLKRRTRAL